MSKVNDSSKMVAKGRPGGRGVGGFRPEIAGSLGTDSLRLDRDGAGLDWFWKALQRLRLMIAAIEAKFGLLPAPQPVQAPAPEVVDGFRSVLAAPPKAAETASRINLSRVRLIIANRTREEEGAVAKLPPADRAAYRQVAALVETDAEGRLALQNLVLSGKLARSPAAADGISAWQQLGTLSTQALGDGINRQKLVAQLLEELDDPTKIYQGDHNTCVPAAIAIMLAQKQPAELVRLVSGLASAAGTVKLANGDTVSRAPDWQAPDGGRTIDQALFQPAMISYGVQWENLTYDNARDRLSDGGNGLSVEEANVVFQGVTNRGSKVVQFYDGRDPVAINDAINVITRATSRGLPVPVGLSWIGGKGHKILVEKIEAGKVYYTNPYGTRESMSLTEFRKRITNANLPAL